MWQLHTQEQHQQQQDNQKQAAQHQLDALQEQLKVKDEQIKKMTAQAASQQASASYIIHQLQSQLDCTQADEQAVIPAVKAVQTTSEAQGSWSIQEATARVAQVLQAMTTS